MYKEEDMKKLNREDSSYNMFDIQENKNNDESEMNFINLAPKDEIENAENYFRALDWALADEKIFNVALTGPYGSGKSSIINTYIKNRTKKNSILGKSSNLKCLNISLASFGEKQKKKIVKNEDGQNVEVDVSKVEYDNAIEEGILKQLFYKVDYKRIPQSRYRKLHRIKGLKIFRNLCILSIVICLCLVKFFPKRMDTIYEFISNSERLPKRFQWISVPLSMMIFLILLIVISYVIWWLSSRFKVKEVNLVDKAKVSTKEESIESIFNKNLDEIVYFFEMTKYNVVFIEDLDRFGSNDIFVKLRELNGILNNYEAIKRRIVFVYAIKDDMFIGKERTKFFDFIIPIIPIINSTNSEEKFLELLYGKENGNGLNGCGIGKEYITLVSPYIDDMRILTNICNEYYIYRNTLKSINLQPEKMMSLIIFKNLFPKDFADLQKEKGVVKNAFLEKKEFIKKQMNVLLNKKTELEQIIKDFNTDVLESIQELKIVILHKIVDAISDLVDVSGIRTLTIQNQKYSVTEYLDENFDIFILNGAKIEIVYYPNNNRYTDIKTFNDINQIMPVVYGKSITERVEYLKYGSSKKMSDLNQKIECLSIEIENLKKIKLKEILNKYGKDNILSQNIIENDILVFFLRNGYIDETYSNYMNYFHANSLTSDDMNFILSIRNQEAKDFSFELISCKKITEKLLNYEFEQKEIYNYSLLDYLIAYEPNSNKCQLFIKQLSNEDEVSWRFIDGFIDVSNNKEKFIELLANEWAGMWKYIADKPYLSEDRKQYFFKLIISYVDIDTIEKLNIENEFYVHGYVYRYMVSDVDILQKLKGVNEIQLVNLIKRLNIHFSNINCNNISNYILDFIFKNNYYHLNYDMLKSIVMYKKPEDIDRLSISNYTVIRNMGYEPLLYYINENFDEYIDDIVLGIETNTQESKEIVIYIVRKLINSPNKCCEIIEKQDFKLDSFAECCSDKIEISDELKKNVKIVWDKFLKTQKIQATWNNVMMYWHNYKLTSELLSYIQNNWINLRKEKDREGITDQFIKDVIIEKMDKNIYKEFLSEFPISEFPNDLTEFSEEQIKVMIELRYFSFTVERLMELSEISSYLATDYILLNKNEYIKFQDDINLQGAVAELLINSDIFTNEEKITIIESLDLSEITLQMAIFVRNTNLKVCKEVVDWCWTLLSTDERYELFINHIEVYSKDELADRFAEFGRPYEELANRSKRHDVWLYDNKYNRKLFNYLYKIDYITSIRDEKDKKGNKGEHIIGKVKQVKK